MARKKSFMIPGLSFSWKRALGITRAKRRLSRKIGIPTSRAGLRQKIGKTATGGCLIHMILYLAVLVGGVSFLFLTIL